MKRKFPCKCGKGFEAEIDSNIEEADLKCPNCGRWHVWKRK